MGRAGIEGATRRTDLGGAGAYISDIVGLYMNGAAIAGVLLLISSILLYVVLIGTLFFSSKPLDESEVVPVENDTPQNKSSRHL
ncbi:MAG UNVERIFIED_CONTAM: hypothetical protein LVT10_19490 [Anaerolineae bacterium]|jgi:hypothetical protein